MDLSSYWVFYQKYKGRSGQVFLILIALLVGWQLGRIMSPYYASTPIVFEDGSCEQSGGSEEELMELEKGNDVKAAGADKVYESDRGGEYEDKVVEEVAGVQDKGVVEKGKYVGSINSDLFHDLSCSHSKRIKEENRVWFSSVEEAEGAGYSPSKCTEELLEKD